MEINSFFLRKRTRIKKTIKKVIKYAIKALSNSSIVVISLITVEMFFLWFFFGSVISKRNIEEKYRREISKRNIEEKKRIKKNHFLEEQKCLQ